jgi:N-acetylglucosamine kinase
VSALVAGIDGGQSSTVAAIGDETGRVLGRGRAGPADEIGQGSESTRLREALRGALDAACRAAALPQSARFDAIVAGISGYDGHVYGRAPELPSDRVVLLHDTPIAHAGALGGRAGVIAIAGTGSVVYGRDDRGWSCTLGGWGYVFGDEGSAFGIARDSLAMLMRAQDERDASLEEASRAACAYFGADSLRALVHAFYKGGIARDRLASYARHAMRSDAFAAIVDRGASSLATLVGAAIAAGAPARVSLVGGVFADAAFRSRVEREIRDAHPAAEMVAPRYEPECGALLLAYREAGLAVEELR